MIRSVVRTKGLFSLEEQVVISVVVARNTFTKINLRNINPPDSLGNFVCSVKFKKTKGYGCAEKAGISLEGYSSLQQIATHNKRDKLKE